jgi:hypothetical protein
MSYKDRTAKDRKILVGISKLSLPERFRRIHELELALKSAEADVVEKTSNKARTKKQETQLLADEDGIIELRYRRNTQLRPEFVENKSQKRWLG